MGWRSVLRYLPLFNNPQAQLPLSPAPNGVPALTVAHRHAFIAHASLPNAYSTASITPQILFNDVLLPPTGPRIISEDYTAAGERPATLKTRRQTVARPRTQSSEYQHLRKLSIVEDYDMAGSLEWDEVETEVPDVGDRPTLLELAKITGDAYSLPGDKDWYDVDGNWNSVRHKPGSSHGVS